MGNGMNKILPGLYLGDFRDARNILQLGENKITHILSIHDNAQPLLSDKVYLCIQAGDNAQQDIAQFIPQTNDFIHQARLNNGNVLQKQYLCISARDHGTQDLTQHFSECSDFIHQARLGGGAVLVHCLAGVSRSVSITVAYIMTVTPLGWREALNVVRGSRRCANPNFGFQRQLLTFQHEGVYEERKRLKAKFAPSPYNDLEECQILLKIHQDWVLHGKEPDSAATYPLAHGAYSSSASSSEKAENTKVGDKGKPRNTKDESSPPRKTGMESNRETERPCRTSNAEVEGLIDEFFEAEPKHSVGSQTRASNHEASSSSSTCDTTATSSHHSSHHNDHLSSSSSSSKCSSRVACDRLSRHCQADCGSSLEGQERNATKPNSLSHELCTASTQKAPQSVTLDELFDSK